MDAFTQAYGRERHQKVLLFIQIKVLSLLEEIFRRYYVHMAQFLVSVGKVTLMITP